MGFIVIFPNITMGRFADAATALAQMAGIQSIFPYCICHAVPPLHKYTILGVLLDGPRDYGVFTPRCFRNESSKILRMWVCLMLSRNFRLCFVGHVLPIHRIPFAAERFGLMLERQRETHILFSGTPSKILNTIIMSNTVDVVDKFLTGNSGNKSLGNNAMYKHLLGSVFIKDSYLNITKPRFAWRKKLNSPLISFIIKTPDSSTARYLVPTFIPDNGLPNFIFHNSNILHTRKERQKSSSRLLSVGSYSHLSAYTKIHIFNIISI